MKNIVILLAFLLAVLNSEGQPGKRLILLHTNDLHSRLTGFAPESAYTPLSISDDNTAGGFARIASVIRSEKAAHEGTTVVVDAGDFFMGTLFPGLESETGFQLRLMKQMGYDVVNLGNHEFDFGPAWIAGVIRKSASAGEIPHLLAGNVKADQEDPLDDDFDNLFRDELLTRKIVISRDGIKIGLFSLLGKDAVNVAPAAAPLKFSKQSDIARKLVKELALEKCDIIICLSHSGIEKDKNGNWTGEDIELAERVKGIDLIVGGHTHTRLDQPLVVNGVPIVQTGEFGKNIGRISILLTGGKPVIESYRLISVDDGIAGDKDIAGMIEDQKRRISDGILSPIGLGYSDPIAESGFVIEGNDTGEYTESNLGPVVADAIHSYVNRESSEGTDISIVAAGMLFDRILPGIQTAPDIFRIMPLGSGKDSIPGYPLARLYFTGKELKSILEILQVVYKSNPQNYCYYSGVRVEFDPGRGLLRKIRKISIVRHDGSSSEVDFSRRNKTLYSVTADLYMLQFFGLIKKSSMGLINVVPKDKSGNRITDMSSSVIDMDEKKEGVQEGKEWLALLQFFSSMKDVNGNGIPDIDRKYAVPVKCFFPVK